MIDVMHPYCDGTWAEFGVFKGATASMAAAWRSRFCGSVVDPVYGFDTFTGLPGDWHFFKSGDFSLEGQLPDVPDNVELVKVGPCGAHDPFLAKRVLSPGPV